MQYILYSINFILHSHIVILIPIYLLLDFKPKQNLKKPRIMQEQSRVYIYKAQCPCSSRLCKKSEVWKKDSVEERNKVTKKKNLLLVTQNTSFIPLFQIRACEQQSTRHGNDFSIVFMVCDGFSTSSLACVCGTSAVYSFEKSFNIFST